MATDEDILRAAAAHYYEACLLFEDEDLDPADHRAVLLAAFRSSDCDDFAAALSLATGWESVRMTWLTRHGDAGHHALVRSPEGRLLDVGGWTDPAALRRVYGAAAGSVTLAPGAPATSNLGGLDEDGYDEELARLVGVIRALPHAPYGDPGFRALAARPIEGVDRPAAAAPAP